MDPALQLIMDQFKEMKSDVSDVMEDKVGNCVSTIADGLKTAEWPPERSKSARVDCERGQSRDGRLEGQQKEVTAIVEQQTWHLREDIEATRRELEARLAAVDARAGRAGGGGPGANSTTVKPPKFDGATS